MSLLKFGVLTIVWYTWSDKGKRRDFYIWWDGGFIKHLLKNNKNSSIRIKRRFLHVLKSLNKKWRYRLRTQTYLKTEKYIFLPFVQLLLSLTFQDLVWTDKLSASFICLKSYWLYHINYDVLNMPNCLVLIVYNNYNTLCAYIGK